jgi:hypothetical protein
MGPIIKTFLEKRRFVSARGMFKHFEKTRIAIPKGVPSFSAHMDKGRCFNGAKTS